jgi:hypothetical protein
MKSLACDPAAKARTTKEQRRSTLDAIVDETRRLERVARGELCEQTTVCYAMLGGEEMRQMGRLSRQMGSKLAVDRRSPGWQLTFQVVYLLFWTVALLWSREGISQRTDT